MKKIIVASIATVIMSSIAFKTAENEEALFNNSYVEVFALNSEQVSRITEERARYQSIVALLTVLDDREADRILASAEREYERRIDFILNVE